MDEEDEVTATPAPPDASDVPPADELDVAEEREGLTDEVDVDETDVLTEETFGRVKFFQL